MSVFKSKSGYDPARLETSVNQHKLKFDLKSMLFLSIKKVKKGWVPISNIKKEK